MRTFKLFGYGGIVLAGLGLLVRIFLPNMAKDIQMRSSYFVIPYSVIFESLSLLFILFSITYYLYSKLFGRLMNSFLGKLHFWLMFIPILLIWFVDYHLIDVPRRTYRFDSNIAFYKTDEFAICLLLVLIFAQLIFIFNLIYSNWKGKKINNSIT